MLSLSLLLSPFFFCCKLQFALRNALSFPSCRFSIAHANRKRTDQRVESRADQPAGPDLNVDIAHTHIRSERDRERDRQTHNKN